MIPVAGNLAAPIHAAEHSKKLEAALKKQVKEAFPEIVKKLVNEATADLNNQTTQALTKLDTLITARNQEVEQAQRAILHMEKVISELKEQNQDQSEKSEREIKELKELSDKEISKLKNTAVNAAVIIGLLAIIYAISLVLKYIAKPAWLNLAGFFPKSKKRKVITVEEEEEAEENIFEVEEKPKLPKKVKVLRSNTKVKPKSNTK